MILFAVLLTSVLFWSANGLEKPYVSVSPPLPKKGDTLVLSCLGNFTHDNTSYVWFFNGNRVKDQIKTNWVQIANGSSTGFYSCLVNTSIELSSSDKKFVSVSYLLDAPEIKLLSLTSSSLEISWSLPSLSNKNLSAVAYHIYYRKVPSAFSLMKVADVEKYNLTSLLPASNYDIQVSAVNRYGAGANSSILEGRTNDSRSSNVQNLTAFGRSQRIYISWERPSNPNGNITSYQICTIQTFDDEEKILIPKRLCSVGNELNYTFTGLGKYIKYDVEVSAVNKAGIGEPSTILDVMTSMEAPMKVQNVRVNEALYYSISLTWSTPAHLFGKLRGYNVSYSSDGENFTLACSNTLKLICFIGDLSPSQIYTIKITVSNSLFMTSMNTKVATLNVTTPAKYDGELPIPNGISKHSISIQLINFEGPTKFYDVILMELGSNAIFPERGPNSYTSEDITNGVDGLYVAGRVFDSSGSAKDFIIGEGLASEYKRNITSLPAPKSRRLKENTYYGVFVRGYADDDVYQSTAWYSPVRTMGGVVETTGGGTIAAIIVVLTLVVAVIIALLYVIRTKKWTLRLRKGKGLGQHRQNSLDKHTHFIGGADDPRVPISIEAFQEHVYQLNANSKYSFCQQYSMISRELDKTYDHSRYHDNNIKNRYHNVPAYDETRVVLDVIDNDPHSDYINANHIDGFEIPKEYIATQGPLPETVFDFWRMAWEYDVSTIVMLTKLEEKGRVKCAQYWPQTNAIIVKDIVITLTDIQEFPDHVVRTFHVTRTAQAVEKVVRQYHFIAWPDFGVPEDPSALLCFIRKVNNWKSNASPAIIHCSAGVGRTGTYITIDSQIRNAQKNKEICIFNNVSDLRLQRCLMVQTEDQYIFIHHAMLAFLDSDETEVDASELNEYINLKAQVDSKTGMSGFFEEFIRLAKTDQKDKFTESNRPVNIPKNRYKNICPYDDTRVCLLPYPGLEGSDYINANFVDSYVYKDNFIATQAPLENTASDFWRMTWEQNSEIIVMLVKETDPGKANISSYFPYEKASMKIGYFIIELGCETTYGDYIQREIKVTNTEASSSRKVHHFHYTTWPEGGLPENGLGLVELIGQVRRLNDILASNPIIIHCSGGVGRTGVFIALSNLIERVKAENVVDVYQTVKKMRLQRTAMVQTKDQYEFCYRVVQEFLASFDLYANFSSKDSSD